MAMNAQNAAFLTAITVLLVATQTEQYKMKFSYNGATGPENWGNLNPSFWRCSKGKSQSPINIVKKEVVRNPRLGPLIRDYTPIDGTLIDNGFNIGLLCTNGCGEAIVNGKNYTFKQLHWHSPSEHTLDGVRYPVELHLVHMADDGSLSVVAFLYKYGRPDHLIAQIKRNIDELEKDVTHGNEDAHVPVGVLRMGKHLKQKTRNYFRYFGSLTSPPCTENVIWSICGKVREISREQVVALKAPLDGTCKNNYRPLQQLNGRRVELYDEENID